MKFLEKLEGSENYTATVVRLPPKQKVEGLDRLMKVTVFGNDVLVGKDSDENCLYLFFPAECVLSEDYLSRNNEYRHSEKNIDRSKTGFFEDSGRVKAIKFKGVISTGYLAPITSLPAEVHTVDGLVTKLHAGDEFNVINGYALCKKYKPARMQASGNAESRFNKKLRRFDKLVANQFRFHVSTPPLAKCMNQIHPEDRLVITHKWHGTSAVFSNVLIKKELSWRGKLAQFLGIDVVTTAYDNLYSSRSVIKNQYINKEATAGYYNEDIWGIVNNEIKDKIEQGISLYGEIVGYLTTGKHIQHGYDYGCGENQHKFVVYRVTYTKPDGTVIEYNWDQLRAYCAKYQLETVKEIPFVGADKLAKDEHWHENLLAQLQMTYLEEDCPFCHNKVPAEGIVLRVDNRDTFTAFKLKSKRFLERETKQIDAGTVDIEEEQSVSETV